MLKVLLVDDEPFIVQGLKVLMDWEAEGFEIVRTAENGAEALAFLRTAGVDLIIADIRMPVMTGLELLERIRTESLSDAYFVILSGYSDFDYARQALKYECMDYILKPVQKEELCNTLNKIRMLHESSLQRKEREQEQEQALFARNLIAIICGKFDRMNMDYVAGRLKTEGGLRYIDIEVDDHAAVQTQEACDKRSIQRRLYRHCRELLKEEGFHCILDVSRREEDYDIGFIYCGYMALHAGMTEQEYLDGFLEKLTQRLKLPVVMFVGHHVDSLKQLSESYRTATVARSFRNFQMDASVQAITWYEENETGIQGNTVLCKESMDALVQAVEQNQRDAFEPLIDRIYGEINGCAMDAKLVNLNINYLLFQLVHLAQEEDETVSVEEVDSQVEILRLISTDAFDAGTMRGSRMHLIRFAQEYAEYLAQLRNRSAKGVLAQVERDVREQYADNLTLKELSARYYVNSAYLGQMFRKQYGLSFRDYLNNYRIEQAAMLLIRTELKNYEIAEQVGYHDLDYFINKFIALKGCSPAKFRKNSRSTAESD